QLISYAVAQFAHQFRTHLFMVLVRGKTARFIRWDHAGAIVSNEFEYAEKSYLADFYARYTHATLAARGIDTTVESIPFNTDEAARARTALQDKGFIPKTAKMAPIFKFHIWDNPNNSKLDDDNEDEHDEHGETQESPLSKTYYGSTPFFNAIHSITSRATRVFKVWDPESDTFVLLKSDSWRVNSTSIKPEGKVYARLHAKRVRNIPTCLEAGDVNPSSSLHRTLTQLHDDSLRSHIHYQLTLKEICVGNVIDFKDTKELTTILRDALIAHDDALRNSSILHRDVSVGNILIFEDDSGKRKGVLNDWELCKDLRITREAERMGTWQFISAALLQTPVGCHEPRDDFESFFHVLGWTALKFAHHN
ncbi:hypothetical protein K435DRAFT_607675, partial [Dendrothele bispora CBS 962.96]